ncbi:MAG TPA: aldehyde dehydrogenase family protein [Acidimicrobiia bacterium]|nr:aldehyde dehydrogenase family protein [Acidimicrobiia bacterium]
MDVPALSATEARVLGCLMEKAATTPEHYPLSLNAVVTACNQSTNRDPVVHYDDDTAEAALTSLRERGLARRIKAAGARVIKYSHVVDEALSLDAGARAVLGVLLLRGEQTPGELRARTERWHTFATADEIDATLRELADRGLVAVLARRPGQKEARWTQLLTPVSAPESSPVATHATPEPDVATDDARTLQSAAPMARRLVVRDPATGAVLDELDVDDERAVDGKIARARAAQPHWAARAYDDRALALLAFRDLLERDEETLARTTTEETGKPIRQSRNEIRAARERVEWFVDHVPAATAPSTVTERVDLVERVTYEPAGVVAHISAWNYPYFVALNSVVPALLTGNAVLYKPSEHATRTGTRIVRLLHEAGVPLDVVQLVVGAGPTGGALAAGAVDVVCFTGSYRTGVAVAQAAAANLTRVQLELGGKDGAYVCDDVDIAATAAAVAEGVFYNAGQSCCAIERLYVHDAVHDAFVAALVEIADAYVVGDPLDERTDIGPLARFEQLDVLDAQVADAVAKGARVVAGGGRHERGAGWYRPTVIADATPSMRVMRDESFGPIIGVQRVADDEHALVALDDTDYGLTGAVFTRDRARAERILARLDTGTVYWNCSDRTTTRLPWAGRRHSGLGVSLSEAGVRAFVREKAWHEVPPHERGG